MTLLIHTLAGRIDHRESNCIRVIAAVGGREPAVERTGTYSQRVAITRMQLLLQLLIKQTKKGKESQEYR